MRIIMRLDGEINIGIRKAILEIVGDEWMNYENIIAEMNRRQIEKRFGLDQPLQRDWIILSLGQLIGMRKLDLKNREMDSVIIRYVRKK